MFRFGTCPTGMRAISFLDAMSTAETELEPALATRHHVAFAEERPKCPHCIRDASAGFNGFLISFCSPLVPPPSFFKRFDLRGGLRAVSLSEWDVVILIALERRIEVNEIDGFVLDVPAQHVQVVAVIEEILIRRHAVRL